MVKCHEVSFDYKYALPVVSLAYFLRYPNPYATHVLSTDVIDRQFDPITQQLYTTRLHYKKSKIPPAILKLLPRGILGGASGNDAGESFVLERSTVNAREGWMKTESRNLEWTGILSVVERQHFRRAIIATQEEQNAHKPNFATVSSYDTRIPGGPARDLVEETRNEHTDVTTSVRLVSKFGQARIARHASASDPELTNHGSEEIENTPKRSFLASWSTMSLQRSIEMIGLRRTREATNKSNEGMRVVLERYCRGGLGMVLEGMQEDRRKAMR